MTATMGHNGMASSEQSMARLELLLGKRILRMWRCENRQYCVAYEDKHFFGNTLDDAMAEALKGG